MKTLTTVLAASLMALTMTANAAPEYWKTEKMSIPFSGPVTGGMRAYPNPDRQARARASYECRQKRGKGTCKTSLQPRAKKGCTVSVWAISSLGIRYSICITGTYKSPWDGFKK